MNQEQLKYHLNATYASDTLYYQALSDYEKDLMGFVLKLVNKNVHPVSYLNPEAYVYLKNFTNIDFDNIKFGSNSEQVTLSVPVDIYTVPAKLSIPLKIDITSQLPKQSACYYYSCANNLSEEYQFANPVEFATCANKEVDSMYCRVTIDHSRCPSFKPDFIEYAQYVFDHEESQYRYNVIKYRHKYGNHIFHIYDQNNNLLNELTYDFDTYSKINQEDLSNEIKSIVKEIHNNIFYKEPHTFTEETLEKEPKAQTKSYLATLVS